jgi:hypothetical protein
MKITGLKINIFSSQHKNAKRNWLIVRTQTDERIEGNRLLEYTDD